MRSAVRGVRPNRFSFLRPSAGDAGMAKARDLAERQSNLYRITRDIVQKRNR